MEPEKNPLIAVLQAYGVAVAALLATHPQPHQLRSAFETMAVKAPHPDPLFQSTLETLRAAISPH